jgi:uncharacterized protein
MWTTILLTISNVFMTFAWYYHLKNPWLKASPIWMVVLVSWGIAFFEYCFQVPGNRIGNHEWNDPAKLKILQEAITLVVFSLFSWLILKKPLSWNHYVGFACVMVGVFVVFHFDRKPAELASANAPTITSSAEAPAKQRSHDRP